MCATSPTTRARSQRADVNAVLAELGIDAEGEPDRLLEVWNKADLLDAAALQRARNEARRAERRARLGGDRLWASTRCAARSSGRLNRARETIEIALKPEEGCAVELDLRELRGGRARRIWARASPRLRIRVAPEKRERLARLAGPARLRLAAE